MQEPDLPGLVDNELSGLYVAAERLDLKWNYWTDYGQVLVSTSCRSANNEQQTRKEAHQARRTGRQSIICQRETQIEKKESLTEEINLWRGESDKKERGFCCTMGSTHFLMLCIPNEQYEDTWVPWYIWDCTCHAMMLLHVPSLLWHVCASWSVCAAPSVVYPCEWWTAFISLH